jgi:hypothetical protein
MRILTFLRNVARLVGFWLRLSPIIVRILWARACWRAYWFILVRYLILNKDKWMPLVQHLEATLEALPEVTDVTVSIYFRPGYGYAELFEGHNTLYWEAPLTITVWTKSGPTLGLGLEVWNGTLRVRQLQGVLGVQIPESLRKWPQQLVQACVEFADATSTYREVRIYKADQSLFYKHPDLKVGEDEEYDDVLRAHQQRMRRRYDGTARQLKFAERSHWYVREVRT